VGFIVSNALKLMRVDFEIAVEKPTLQFIQNQSNETLPNPIEGNRLRPVHRAFCMQRPYRIHTAYLQWLLA
jgi:hypothetical protein